MVHIENEHSFGRRDARKLDARGGGSRDRLAITIAEVDYRELYVRREPSIFARDSPRTSAELARVSRRLRRSRSIPRLSRRVSVISPSKSPGSARSSCLPMRLFAYARVYARRTFRRRGKIRTAYRRRQRSAPDYRERDGNNATTVTRP